MRKVRFTIIVLTINILLSSSCSSFLKGTTSNINRLLTYAQKNTYTALSVEDVATKKSLNKEAFSKLLQADSLSKEKDEQTLHRNLNFTYALYYHATGDNRTALEFSKKAIKFTPTTTLVTVLHTRIILKLRGNKYARKAIQRLLNLELRYKNIAMLHLALGDAYYYLNSLNKAKQQYTKVLFIGENHQVEAANRIETLNKIAAIKIRSKKFKNLLLIKTIKRNNIAYILHSVFRINRRFKIRKKPTIALQDITNNTNKTAITKLYNAGMFSYIKNGKFAPFTIVTRGEMAKIIEDYIVLRTANIDHRTRYKTIKKKIIMDIDKDHMYFNAINLATRKKIMNLSLSGFMNPDSTISGIDALLIIKKMLQKI